jgi:protein-L-isoaspartate(D-aspartate) O-methyltransferase
MTTAVAPEAETRERAQFTLRMRQRGLADVRVLRALERTPRSFFVPQRYADIAARDIALPIGGGQTAPPPSTVAAMIEALKIAPGHRVLEIGAGSGYATALLSQLAGEVVSLERSQTLAVEAAARLSAYGLANVRVLHADGLASADSLGAFERVVVHALIEPPAPRLTRWLAPGGMLVAGLADEGGQRIVRLALSPRGELKAEALGLVRTLSPLVVGLMRAL